MNRLFQHYEGEIAAIKGLKLRGLNILTDDESEKDDVILFWLQTEKKWLRIFIDGSYCGVDQYDNDESDFDIDIDDFVTFKHQNEWVKDFIIKRAIVQSEKLPLISLTIYFTNGSKLIYSCDENENCSIHKYND